MSKPQTNSTAIAASYIPFGEAWEKEIMKTPKPFIIEMLRKALLANQAAADAVPTNWCDSLLTGKDAALSNNAGSWGCPDIERLLLGVKRRIQSGQNVKGMAPGSAVPDSESKTKLDR